MQCLVPRTMPYKMITGHGATDPCSREGLWPEMLDLVGNMKCCVLWGSNPAQSDIGSCERGLDELRQAGVKTVVVDPRFTPDASKADIWLPVRPGTDVAVTMSWIKYIMDNEKYDRDFVMRWSTMPYLVNTETMRFVKPEDAGEEAEEYAYMVWDAKTGSAKKMSYPYDESLEPALEGGPYIVNGIECKPGFQMLKERVAEWTFEKAGEISWVEPALIEEACKLYAENTPGSLCTGMAGDHNINSVQFGMSAAILEGLMGNGYKPGTIMQKFVGGVTDYWSGANTLNYFMTKDEYEKEFGLADYRGILAAGFIHNAYLLKGLLEGDPYQPHVMIDESLNKMTNMPQADLWEEGFRKLDFIVHHTMYPTSFSMLADYLLPQAEILEMNFVWGLYNVGYVRQAATHLWEVIEEPLFFSLLAKKMAEKGMPRFQRACDAAAVLPDAEPLPEGYIGDTGDWGAIPYWSTTQEMHDELWKQQGLEHNWESYVRECEEKGYYEAMGEQEFKDYQYYHYEQIDEETGLPNGFSTTTKKMQLYCDDWIEMGLNGYPYSDYVLDPSPLEYDPMPFYQEPPARCGAGGGVPAGVHRRPQPRDDPRDAAQRALDSRALPHAAAFHPPRRCREVRRCPRGMGVDRVEAQPYPRRGQSDCRHSSRRGAHGALVVARDHDHRHARLQGIQREHDHAGVLPVQLHHGLHGVPRLPGEGVPGRRGCSGGHLDRAGAVRGVAAQLR